MPHTTNTQLPNDFDGWWNMPGDWVEPPNQARSGWSGVMRVAIGQRLYYAKKQQNYLCRSWRHPFGLPTASREFANLRALANISIPVPVIVFHGTLQTPNGKQAILVTESLDGFVDFDNLPTLSNPEANTLAHLTGNVIGRLHRAGFRHGCLYGKHLMARDIHTQPEIALIDLEKLRRDPMIRRAIRHDLEQLKRRQRIWQDEHWEIFLDSHRKALNGSRN